MNFLVTSCGETPPPNNDGSRRSVDVGEKQNVSASTPVKNDRSSGRIDMSNNNISPIHDYHPDGTGRRTTTVSDLQQTSRSSTSASPSSVLDRSPAATPYVRPASGRSAMDLYAAIHESKKRLLAQQSAAAAVTAATAAAIHRTSPPKPVTATTSTAIRRQPPVERQSGRYRPRDDRSARYDFKRLLLQTNMAGGRRAQQSAVVRLQQPVAPPMPRSRVGPAVIGKKGGPLSSSWKSNVLSSTIQEDCREDEDYCRTGTTGVPKSAALVNHTLKGFAAATCSTLETALWRLRNACSFRLCVIFSIVFFECRFSKTFCRPLFYESYKFMMIISKFSQ